MKESQKIAVNTGFLYTKMVITMIISLYSTRLILKALGVENYGIFALIGGVIGLLQFLNGAMSSATQRYFSFYLGSGNEQKLKSVFTNSVIIHFVIGLFVVLILEIAGIFLFDGVLKIPVDRIPSAKIVFHLMIVSTFFNINAVPYNAAINAHENFLYDSLVGVFESVMKLCIAIVLIYASSDKLVLYGILMASLAIVIRLMNSLYSNIRFKECRFSLKTERDMPLMKEMFSYAGWILFGTLSSVAKDQGLAFVLNLRFGIVVNAAYGVANQVNGQLSNFTTNMYRALIPQIVKSEGGGDRNRMIKLAVTGCRTASVLMGFLSIPLIVEMSYILNLWLTDVPENAVIFCQLILVLKLSQLLTSGLIPAINATGRIKVYTLIVGTTSILTLPLAIVLLLLGLPAYSVLIGAIFIELVVGGIRVYNAEKIIGISFMGFVKNVVFKVVLLYIISFGATLMPSFFMKDNFVRLVVTGIISSVVISLLAWFFVFSEEEKAHLKGFMRMPRKLLAKVKS